MEQPVVQTNAWAGQKTNGGCHLKTGHFYFAENRTFLFCLDKKP